MAVTMESMDLVMIRPPGIENGAFVVSTDCLWYAHELLPFPASVATDTGSESFDCAPLSTLKIYDDTGYYLPHNIYVSCTDYCKKHDIL